MKNEQVLTIKVHGANIEGLRGLMDCVHTFLEYEEGLSVKQVYLKEESKTNTQEND